MLVCVRIGAAHLNHRWKTSALLKFNARFKCVCMPTVCGGASRIIVSVLDACSFPFRSIGAQETPFLRAHDTIVKFGGQSNSLMA